MILFREGASALHWLGRAPLRTLVLVVTIGFGVGLSTAGWAIFEAILVRELPYKQPVELLKVWTEDEALGFQSISARTFRSLRTGGPPTDQISTYFTTSMALAEPGSEESRRVKVATVSWNLFETLGVAAFRGRTFSKTDGQSGGLLPVVVSERLRGRNLTLRLGETLTFNGRRVSVIGVMPTDFWFPDQETNVWLVEQDEIGSWSKPAIARLAEPFGNARVFVEEASQKLPTAGTSSRVAAESYAGALSAGVKGPLLIVQAGASAVLLLVTVSAGWLLTASTRRQTTQIAIKSALGATTNRLIREKCAELAILLTMSLLAAVVFAAVAIRWTSRAYAEMVPRIAGASLSELTIVVAVLASLVVCVLAGLPSLLMVKRVAAAADIRQSLVSWRPRRRDAVLMTAYGTVALVLAIGSVLLLLTFRRLIDANVGFSNTSVIGVRVDLPGDISPQASIMRVRQVVDALRAEGMKVTVTNAPPLGGYDEFVTAFADYESKRRGGMVAIRLVDAAFFQVMGLPIHHGRPLMETTDHTQVVVDQDMALRLWGIPNPVGQRFRMGSGTWTVVGVSKPVGHRRLLEGAPPAAYVLYSQESVESLTLHTRLFILADRAAGGAVAAQRIRHVMNASFPEASGVETWDFRTRVRNASGTRPFVTTAATVFATLAIGLLAAAFCGMLMDLVMSRKREIGVRLALGSSPARVAYIVTREAAGSYLAAAAAASALLWIFAGVIDRSIFIPDSLEAPQTWVVLSITFATVLAVVATSCYWPVRRAMRISPSELLRSP